MKYHITLARNDVIGKLGGSRFPYSLDDFNEPCTAVIVKKKLARQVFARYSSTRGDPKVTGIELRRGERVGKLIVRPGVC